MSLVAYWSNHRRAMEPQFSADNISPITLWLGKAGCGQEFAANLDATKVGTNWSVIHSAMDAAKSIPSPIRCLTSLSHARGLVP